MSDRKIQGAWRTKAGRLLKPPSPFDGGGDAPELVKVRAVPDPAPTLPVVRMDFPQQRHSDVDVDRYLEAVLDFPRERVTLYRDPSTEGLQCRVGAHRVTWQFYHDDRRGGRRRITSKRLGFFPGMSAAEARNAARIERGKVAAGEVGPGKREAIKLDAAMAEYIDHLERKAARNDKPARWALNVRNYAKNHILPRFGTWTLADLAMQPGVVADWHKDVPKKSGEVTANHCCRVLRAAYSGAPSATYHCRSATRQAPSNGIVRNPLKPRWRSATSRSGSRHGLRLKSDRKRRRGESITPFASSRASDPARPRASAGAT
jgi:hypothetical protein